MWFVTGTPSGEALAEAAAQVIDDLSDRTRAHLNSHSRAVIFDRGLEGWPPWKSVPSR